MHSRRRKLLLKHFPMLSHCPHDNYLSLFSYAERIPECFYAEVTFRKYLYYLEALHISSPMGLKTYFTDNENRLSKSFLFLAEINQYGWHDTFEEIDDYEQIRFIDQQIHPAYLRLIEAVFYPFIHLIAFFSRTHRGKSTNGLEIFNTAEELQNTSFSDITDLYRNIVRNSVAHGGIEYIEKEIRYHDDKGNEEVLSDSQIIRLVDDLVDACNAMALALKIFIYSHTKDGYNLPKQIFLEQFQAETDTPWWHIVGCMPSRFASQNQLIIYARPTSYDYNKVLYSTFLSGVLAEYFAPGYDRYFFSLRSSKTLPGWASFDGKKLREIRNKDAKELTDYQGALENNLVFYTPKIRLTGLLRRLDTFIQSFRIHWPLALSDFRDKMGWPNVVARVSKIHRAGWGTVLNGSVFITGPEESTPDQALIRRNCGRIIRVALSNARTDKFILSVLRFLPLRFARIAVFKRNYRKRRLSNFGLGEDLICVIQVKRFTKIRAPDICGSTIEIKGKYRIAWNAAWLAKEGNR